MVREPVRSCIFISFVSRALAAPASRWHLMEFHDAVEDLRSSLSYELFCMRGSAEWIPFVGPSTNSPLTVDQAYRKTPFDHLSTKNGTVEDPGMYRVLAR